MLCFLNPLGLLATYQTKWRAPSSLLYLFVATEHLQHNLFEATVEIASNATCSHHQKLHNTQAWVATRRLWCWPPPKIVFGKQPHNTQAWAATRSLWCWPTPKMYLAHRAWKVLWGQYRGSVSWAGHTSDHLNVFDPSRAAQLGFRNTP